MNENPSTKIDKRAINAWRLTALLLGILFFVPAIAYVVISVNIDKFEPFILVLIVIPALIIYFLISIILPKLRWQRWSYEIDNESIDMLRGFVFKKRTVVPINRVQHVDTNQGPIYRKYDLSSIKISTAATTHEIPALDEETATEVRNTISRLVRQVKDDV